MICPSGLLSGRFMRSTKTTRTLATAMSSGASTSTARTPEMSDTRSLIVGMLGSSLPTGSDEDEKEVDGENGPVPIGGNAQERGRRQTFFERGPRHRETGHRWDQDQVTDGRVLCFGRAPAHVAYEQEHRRDRAPGARDVGCFRQVFALVTDGRGRSGRAAGADVQGAEGEFARFAHPCVTRVAHIFGDDGGMLRAFLVGRERTRGLDEVRARDGGSHLGDSQTRALGACEARAPGAEGLGARSACASTGCALVRGEYPTCPRTLT